MTTITCEIQWLVYLLQDFNVPSEQLSLLYCDNDLARYVTTNLVFHEPTKHVEIDYHILDKIEEWSNPFASHFHHRATS